MMGSNDHSLNREQDKISKLAQLEYLAEKLWTICQSSVLMPAALKNENKFVVVMPLLQDSGTFQG